MQIDVDMEDLLETIQNAAIRRSLFVGAKAAMWHVINPDGGQSVGSSAQLEKIFAVLDKWEIVNEPPSMHPVPAERLK